MKISRRLLYLASFVCLAALAAVAQQPSGSAQPALVPEISADLGSCSADFNVADMAGKPIYAARVHTLIRYGFLSKRKTELEAYTSAEGKVRFTHLPDQASKPIQFDISYQGDTAHISYDPATSCHGKYDVPLRAGPSTPAKGKK